MKIEENMIDNINQRTFEIDEFFYDADELDNLIMSGIAFDFVDGTRISIADVQELDYVLYKGYFFPAAILKDGKGPINIKLN